MTSLVFTAHFWKGKQGTMLEHQGKTHNFLTKMASNLRTSKENWLDEDQKI